MTIEICAASFRSAEVAAKAGADRIELCAALPLGGLTPSYATIALAKAQLQIPTYVLIRAREGDFCYSEAEMQVMLRDIEHCKALGVEGIVWGALLADGSIAEAQTQRILESCKGMDFTFHRAFDRCKNPLESVEILYDLGVRRILTSGQQSSALKGVSLLKTLVEKTKGRMSIMPGAGISSDNILTIRNLTEATEFHLSAKETIKSPFLFQNDINDTLHYDETDIDKVKKVLEIVK
jgi:copper homeostasis protein